MVLNPSPHPADIANLERPGFRVMIPDPPAEPIADDRGEPARGRRRMRATEVPVGAVLRCPDCRDGKHGACIGTVFNEATEGFVECECPHRSSN